jgi:mlo protein
MGSSFKKDIFEEHIQVGLVGWARGAKKNKRKAANGSTTTHHGSHASTTHGSSHVDHKETTPLTVQLTQVAEMESAMEEGNAGGIEHATVSDGHQKAPSTL